MANRLDSVSSFLQGEIDRGSFPGAQYLVSDNGEVVGEDALGMAVVDPLQIPVTLSTIFDLASLTKPLATSLLAVILAERDLLDLSAKASDYIKELRDHGDKRAVTIVQLLTHTSGFQRWLPLHKDLKDPSELAGAIARSPLDNSSNGGRPVVYSDLNYLLLGNVIERLSGQSLGRLFQSEIAGPLRLTRTMFNPPERLKPEIAATGDEQQVIWGTPHDPNAAFNRGVAGHAGLFSTAREVFKICEQFWPGAKLVSGLSLALFTENLTRGSDDHRSVAWLLASTADCSAGPALPPTALGHTGFTGTSIWIDPQKKRALILLTNRLHPRQTDFDMKPIRQRFNTLAVEQLDRNK